MGISFSITRTTDNVITPTNYQKANAAKQSDASYKKTINATDISSDTKVDDLENERLLRKMKMAKTRLDTLGEYLGAMQTAQKESGSNGLALYRRVNHLTDTEDDYRKSREYKNKKNTDTFISDQMEAMNEKLEEIMAFREALSEKDTVQANEQETTNTTDNNNITTTEDISAKATSPQTDTKTVSANNTDVQLKAAQTYKKSDMPLKVEQSLNNFI